MAEVRFHKVALLPDVLEPNAWYLVHNGAYAETYVTNHTGAAKMVGNSIMINNLIAEQLLAMSLTYIVNDIAERDILGSTLISNAVVQVIDATSDSSVNSGGATYIYNSASHLFLKVAEFESMDSVINWSNIIGKPSSSIEQIDAAVSNSHTHNNKTLLDSLTSIDGVLYLNGVEVKNWNVINW